MRVLLPWPHKHLSPNSRAFWAAKATIAARYQADAYVLALEAGGVKGSGEKISITFHPPDRRRRDLDNMLASIKSGLDGISRAIRVDDVCFSISIQKGQPVKGGAVVVEITG